jgi:DNA-binding MarR family transcriptional regulator
MIDASAPSSAALASSRASPLFLREAEIRRGIELLYFGYANMVRGADALLARRGLGRAHHRALYFIARQPGLAVSDLLRLLAITKQSLSRVLADLIRLGLVEQAVGTLDRRQRLLRLTAEGEALEAELFEALRAKVATAYAAAGQQAVSGFWAVLSGLVPSPDRAMVEELDRRARVGSPADRRSAPGPADPADRG